MGAPAYYKDNPATRMFDTVTRLRAEYGSRGDRGLPPAAEVVQDVLPDVRNVPIGADGQPLPLVPVLSPEEIAARNAAWERETGQRLDNLNNVIQPGAVSADDDVPAPDFNPSELMRGIGPRTIVQQPAPQAQYQLVMAPPAVRALDFTKLQSISPAEGIVVVDGISFKMTAKEKHSTAVLLADIVQRAMKDQLLEGLKALGLVAEEATDGGKQDVPEVSAGTTSGEVLQGQEKHEQPVELLP